VVVASDLVAEGGDLLLGLGAGHKRHLNERVGAGWTVGGTEQRGADSLGAEAAWGVAEGAGGHPPSDPAPPELPNDLERG
jgi:hypothetical protein